ncbi:single-stranded DNA-binding protein [Streptococcus intermedius]|uniref:single-stranded DNA-binding protein n=1 Tax=Streptococcus intermedius TaxID=1338 RepID=UPI002000EED2|nr:single-stranded DNA-binding protein [Streptococcus intermedius]
MKLEKGDKIKTALSDDTTVLDVKENQAVLFTGKQFVIVSGIKMNEKDGKFEWDNGRYADDLKSISNMQNNSFESMKDTLSFLAEYNHSDFVKGIISLETGVENETVLDTAYDNYMNDSVMGLIDEKFSYFIDEELLETQEEQEKEEQSKEIQEESIDIKEAHAENKKKEARNSGKETDSDKETQDKLNMDGNLVGDVEIKNLKSKDGKEFKVANFSIAQNDKEGNVLYMNCFAYGDKIDQVKDFKKGDFVHLFGKENITQGKNGKEYKSLKVYSAKLLKAKEQVKTNQNTKETKKPSALGKLKEYKEKAGEKPKEQGSIKKEKNVER